MLDKEEVAVDGYGWIKLSRKITRNDFWLNSGEYDQRSAWIYLLLSATYEESKVFNAASKSVITLQPGQVLTSIKSLVEKWGWSYNKVSRYLDNLEKLGMITQNRTTKYTIITLVNWSKYQDGKPRKTVPEQNPAPVPTDGEQPLWMTKGFTSEANYKKFLRGEVDGPC